MNSIFQLEIHYVKTRFSFHTKAKYYQKTATYSSSLIEKL